MTNEEKLKLANDAFNAATHLAVLHWQQDNEIQVSQTELRNAKKQEVKTIRALLEVLLGRTPTDADMDRCNVS